VNWRAVLPGRIKFQIYDFRLQIERRGLAKSEIYNLKSEIYPSICQSRK
jgi:hypothetical protein